MHFDLIVIGSGPAGYKSALTAAHLGAKVALIEQFLPGGTCLNQGCVPKKTLLHLANLLEDVRELHGHGLNGTVSGDFKAALAHKNTVVSAIRANFPIWLRHLGVHLFRGTARFRPDASRAGVHRIAVSTEPDRRADQMLNADRVIIATGSAPIELTNCPTDGQRIINSRHFLIDLDHQPQSVLCVGGGAIGTEFAFLLHQFGSRVTVAEMGSRLLNKAGIPERASGMLERKFDRLGISVRKGVTVHEYVRTPSGVAVTLTDGSRAEYDCVLVAVGRRPMTGELGLEDVGVKLDEKGFVATDDYLQTGVAGIYAAGDVKSGPMTANAALHDAKIAAANAVGGNRLRRNYHRVPIVIDSALEIAGVGLTEDQAEEAGFSPDVARVNFAASAKARAKNDCEGFIEVVHDEETGQLLGGCIVGPEAGEQIHMLAAACQSERGLWFFTDMNYSHPSWTEEIENAIGPYTFAFTKSGKDLFRPGIYAITD